MTLEEAINHLEETLDDKDKEWNCEACKNEHEELLGFLKELQNYRALEKMAVERATQIQNRSEVIKMRPFKTSRGYPESRFENEISDTIRAYLTKPYRNQDVFLLKDIDFYVSGIRISIAFWYTGYIEVNEFNIITNIYFSLGKSHNCVLRAGVQKAVDRFIGRKMEVPWEVNK